MCLFLKNRNQDFVIREEGSQYIQRSVVMENGMICVYTYFNNHFRNHFTLLCKVLKPSNWDLSDKITFGLYKIS